MWEVPPRSEHSSPDTTLAASDGTVATASSAVSTEPASPPLLLSRRARDLDRNRPPGERVGHSVIIGGERRRRRNIQGRPLEEGKGKIEGRWS